jgi:hypothetical protein
VWTTEKTTALGMENPSMAATTRTMVVVLEYDYVIQWWKDMAPTMAYASGQSTTVHNGAFTGECGGGFF